MKHSVMILVAMLLLTGCHTHTRQSEVKQPLAKDKRLAAIYEDLKARSRFPLPRLHRSMAIHADMVLT
jgi:outer membrane PBP1 activator LpoA protein